MKTVGKKKITTGFVIQTFDKDDGVHVCIDQEFVAGDTVDYEDEDGNPIDSWTEYQPFDMVQPGYVESSVAEKLKQALACFEGLEYGLKGEDYHFNDDCAKFNEGLKLLREVTNG